MIRKLFLLLLPAGVCATAELDFFCNLYCFNGGECRHGKGKFGHYVTGDTPVAPTGDTASTEESAEAPLPWVAEGVKDIGMYCACPPGFSGMQCELKMELCPNDQHECFNGQACAKERSMNGENWWRCECDMDESRLDADYALKYCDKVGTTFCGHNPNDFGFDGTSYCKNGGSCNEKVEGQKHIGCTCKEGYEGSHCEIVIQKAFSIEDLTEAAMSPTGVIMLVVGILLCAGCVGGIHYYYDRKYKQQRRAERMANARIRTSYRSNRGFMA